MSRLQLTLLIAGLIALLVIAAAVSAFAYFRKADVKDYDKTGLTYVEYSLSGGMEGGIYSISVSVTGAKTATVSLFDQETHNSRPLKRSRNTDRDRLDGLLEIIDKYGMRDWKDLPKSEIFALDAPSATVEFIISGKSFSFSDGDEFPEGGGAAMADIKNYLEGLFLKKETK